MKKLILLLVLAFCMAFSVGMPAFASERLPESEDLSQLTPEEIAEREEAFLEQAREENEKLAASGGCSGTAAALSVAVLGGAVCVLVKRR